VSEERFELSRRQLLGSSALASLGLLATGSTIATTASGASAPVNFEGLHQAGITTPAQDHLAFASFDLAPGASRAELAAMLDRWSSLARRLAAGRPVPGPGAGDYPPADTGEAIGLGPAGLTVTLGLGTAFFAGLPGAAPRRPGALVDLPAFPGDQLDAQRGGGAICLQLCADDPQVAFHAAHALARAGLGSVQLRALQIGFGRTSSTTADQETARNLLGFKDGTNNLPASDHRQLDEQVWVAADEPQEWMRGGSYLVARRIRMRLESWTSSSLDAQQRAVGRYKDSGAPLGARREHDPVDLTARGASGQPRIPDGAHIRVASPDANAGVRILRRGFGFADGVDPVTGELDAGLFFISFQRDPTRQFAALQQRLAASDALHRYLVHTSSGVYAVPRGLGDGESWGSLILG
jgi:deferrochelatase/peroxidase EfeB